MTKRTAPREKSISANPPPQKKAELAEKDLEKVSGGRPCANGQHIKEGTINP